MRPKAIKSPPDCVRGASGLAFSLASSLNTSMPRSITASVAA